MKYIRILSLLIVGILVAIIGCSDDPSLLGIGLISPQDTIGLQQIEIKADSTRTVISRISGSLSTLVGKYHDPTTSTTTAVKALLQFEGFTNIPDSAIIDTAYITINLNYRFKEMNGFIRFYVHEMDSSWSESTYKWDSLTSTSYNPVYDAIF
ncbi:MAG: hypothetical protein HY800_01760, partial [Ignavibacteriales bacterium]|nr:hypothetical protein [Ignavibacteriales bacterium]